LGIFLDIEEFNKKIRNPHSNIDSLSGFEIIAESITEKIYSIFGRNSLLSMLYQVGSGPGQKIAERIKEKYQKEQFDILEALEILMKELSQYYSVQVRNIEREENLVKIVIENHCFLRKPIKHREKLNFGKSFCRVNKGYFETAFRNLLGDSVQKVVINYLGNDEFKDVCVEELIFHIKPKRSEYY
jgi:Txe/YoeB family toxin of Txe-Axe toxin-antitoxin module